MTTHRLRHGRAPAIAVLLLALLPAVASAAYAPKLSVSLDPATPSATARLSTTITQGPTETANKKVVVSIPKGFGAPIDSINRLPACTTAQVNARACPESTRIGSANATASILALINVGLSGTVNWGGPTGDGRFVVLVFLDNATFGQHLTQRGIISLNQAGGFDTTFDDLPSQVTTTFTLTFDGGARAVLTNPATCGKYTFVGSFTGQGGEQALSEASTTITGCPKPAVTLSRVGMTTRYATFRVSAPAAVRVLVKGPGNRVQLDRRVGASAGKTTLRFKHRLGRGHYRMAVTATGDGATPVTRRARLTVRR